MNVFTLKGIPDALANHRVGVIKFRVIFKPVFNFEIDPVVADVSDPDDRSDLRRDIFDLPDDFADQWNRSRRGSRIDGVEENQPRIEIVLRRNLDEFLAENGV